jgi:hypothetical protein
MTKSETDPKAPRRPFAPHLPAGKTATAAVPDLPPAPERPSIFDDSFARVGAELRKDWSRFDRKR